jgi:hypothetical protein
MAGFLRHGFQFCREAYKAKTSPVSHQRTSVSPMKARLFLMQHGPSFLHGTEAAMSIERDTSPADVNLKKEDPQARKLT